MFDAPRATDGAQAVTGAAQGLDDLIAAQQAGAAAPAPAAPAQAEPPAKAHMGLDELISMQAAKLSRPSDSGVKFALAPAWDSPHAHQ